MRDGERLKAMESRVGGRSGGSREVGAWLFPKIGLAATLRLHCRDWGFSLAQLKTTQQVSSYITVEQKGKWMVGGRENENTHEKWIQSEWNKGKTRRHTSETKFVLCS